MSREEPNLGPSGCLFAISAFALAATSLSFFEKKGLECSWWAYTGNQIAMAGIYLSICLFAAALVAEPGNIGAIWLLSVPTRLAKTRLPKLIVWIVFLFFFFTLPIFHLIQGIIELTIFILTPVRNA